MIINSIISSNLIVISEIISLEMINGNILEIQLLDLVQPFEYCLNILC